MYDTETVPLRQLPDKQVVRPALPPVVRAICRNRIAHLLTLTVFADLTVAVGVLVVALIFGSILAAVLWSCLVLVIGAVILKATWQRLKGGHG